MKRHLIAGTSLFALLIVGCSQAPQAGDETAEVEVTETVVQQTAMLGDFGIELANMDTTVAPGEDFFRYVNGTWLDNLEIPADRSVFTSFNILGDQAEERAGALGGLRLGEGSEPDHQPR